ncbi:flagellar hook-length control protein FliK [Novosphingopyxis baekryungensis]|uniref:flagellar hook-length control protein FliK n=1 Tax=Novosphingopyxis baekryungensis TaxID=279369 RepID=UPI0012EB1CDC|nr:flagellar hook-length control protein FliK [Novosphingopyxis baekryungensis]
MSNISSGFGMMAGRSFKPTGTVSASSKSMTASSLPIGGRPKASIMQARGTSTIAPSSIFGVQTGATKVGADSDALNRTKGNDADADPSKSLKQTTVPAAGILGIRNGAALPSAKESAGTTVSDTGDEWADDPFENFGLPAIMSLALPQTPSPAQQARGALGGLAPASTNGSSEMMAAETTGEWKGAPLSSGSGSSSSPETPARPIVSLAPDVPELIHTVKSPANGNSTGEGSAAGLPLPDASLPRNSSDAPLARPIVSQAPFDPIESQTSPAVSAANRSLLSEGTTTDERLSPLDTPSSSAANTRTPDETMSAANVTRSGFLEPAGNRLRQRPGLAERTAAASNDANGIAYTNIQPPAADDHVTAARTAKSLEAAQNGAAQSELPSPLDSAEGTTQPDRFSAFTQQLTRSMAAPGAGATATADYVQGPPIPFDQQFGPRVGSAISAAMNSMAVKDGTLLLQIAPEHLGKLEIAIDQGSERLHITTENESVRSAIAQAHGRIEQELRSAGHRMLVEVAARDSAATSQNGTAGQQHQAGQSEANAQSQSQSQGQARVGHRDPRSPGGQPNDAPLPGQAPGQRPSSNIHYA